MEPSLATSQSTKKQKYDCIMQKKTTTPTDLLCRGSPNEFGIFLNYTRALRFDDKPNNSYLRKLFHDVFMWEGISMTTYLTGVWSAQRRPHTDSPAESTLVLTLLPLLNDYSQISFRSGILIHRVVAPNDLKAVQIWHRAAALPPPFQ